MLRGSAVQHQAALPWAYPVSADTLRVIVRAERGLLRECHVVYGDRYSPSGDDVPAVTGKVATDTDFDYFQADICLQPPRFRYAFVLDDGKQKLWLHEQGVSASRPVASAFQYPYINNADLLHVPRWLTDGVVYQVFPDRFYNGNPALDPPDVRPWHDERPTGTSLYGGDLEGIIQRLSHLQELGVTVLYLNPLFTSPSHHKYDTTDYFSVDPHFGDEATLKRLVEQCHANGIRVILDAVFNHCGFDFFAFQDVLRHGADSAYADWFHIDEFPVRTGPVPTYETFANGIASMPKLRTENPEVRRYLLDVARYWIETCDIDGWRIDVANEVDHAFWREFRQVVKKTKPDAYIVGEIWHEALPWLYGDQFDGVTNYPVREACLEFFARGRMDAQRFAEALNHNLFIYPEPLLQGSWNLLGSHDTERFVTACGGDMNKVALAVVFNLTWIGTPLVYYGDEIGMQGADDPDCRRPMIWERDRWHDALFGLHRRLIGLRTTTPALQRGGVRIVHADAALNTFVFRRGDPTGGVLVALNNSPKERVIELDRVPSEARWESLTGEATVGSTDTESTLLNLGPYASMIALQHK